MNYREIPYDPHLITALYAEQSVGEPHPAAGLIVEAVESLPQRQRDVVELLMWGGMTKVEAAKSLGYSRSHVHKVWRAAKEALKDVLRDDIPVG